MTTARQFEGGFWWLEHDQPFPFLVYVLHESPDDESVLVLPVHEDVDLASADDLVFDSDEFSCDRSLVVQCRLPFEAPDCFLSAKPFAWLTEHQQTEVLEHFDSERRVVYRTGVLIRTHDDLRWDLMMDQSERVNDFLSFVAEEPSELRLLRQVNALGRRPDRVRSLDRSVLNVTSHNFAGLQGDVNRIVAASLSACLTIADPAQIDESLTKSEILEELKQSLVAAGDR